MHYNYFTPHIANVCSHFLNQKYYKVTTVPIKNLKEAEYILSVIHKKGFNNAKLFIERK